MTSTSWLRATALLLVVLISWPAVAAAAASHRHPGRSPTHHVAHKSPHHRRHHGAARHAVRHVPAVAIDHSGRKQYGKASYYHGRRAGREGAASRTLPLGTKAKVTNLANGKSAEVEITDRGPYVGHRIIDVTPHVADRLGLKAVGVAPVEVKPFDVPRRDGASRQPDDER